MESTGLSEDVVSVCERWHFYSPTKIQALTIPPILGGWDVVGSSPTGSGKTACYVLPILNGLSRRKSRMRSMIIAPTRELSIQVSDVISGMGMTLGVSVSLIVGGQDVTRRVTELSEGSANIVVGTLGSINEIIKNNLNLKKKLKNLLKIVVFDECDKIFLNSSTDAIPILETINSSPKQAATPKQVIASSRRATPEDTVRNEHIFNSKSNADETTNLPQSARSADADGSTKRRKIAQNPDRDFLDDDGTAHISSLRNAMENTASKPQITQISVKQGDSSDISSWSPLSAPDDPRECQLLLFSATLGTRMEQVLAFYSANAGNRSFKIFDLVGTTGGENVSQLLHRIVLCPQIAAVPTLYAMLSNPVKYLFNQSDLTLINMATEGSRPSAGQRLANPTDKNDLRSDCGKIGSNFVGQGFIFVRRIDECDPLTLTLRELGYDATALHSGLDQKARERSLNSFRLKRSSILVATDVAARGLDVPKVNWVISMSVPKFYEDYCHRAGRCARAGQPGVSVMIVTPTFVAKDRDKDIYLQRVATFAERMKKEFDVLDVRPKELYKTSKAQAVAKAGLTGTEQGERVRRTGEKRRRERTTRHQSH